ncbi:MULTISPECIES: iron-siderophore ABC transporter substrate-binding protein [Nocardioides]|uniref:Iron complex transport system substrate-binding protein n=1 Tax=Nocardioides lianchengensis TaxID=1045774 RepID=A0A1G6NKL3_9ACTN|nr:iron-siderophore ABC transporter substrate-binding protein [Nocardioides lianchengensis]NYG10809.1 iron complex transport system substrate-binding protein [Nocardioides lianchengensis]SDC68542.1 iron complex transport system substrate-binding protein [Nocardioides lianchengensis]
MNPTRRRFLTGLSFMAVAPAVLAACGSEDSSSGGSTGGSASEAPADESAFPVTIKHKYGETTVEKAPERVVCIGLMDQDSLLALGIVPVGVTYWFGDEKLQGIYPWAEEAFGDAELPLLLKDADGVEVEKIAGLAPDLIIGQYTGLNEQDYETLSKIAPVVAQSGDYPDYSMPWTEMALTIGTAVGQKAKMQEIIDGVTQQIADAAEAHPEFEGQTAALITPYEGLFIYGPEDPRSRMLTDLGFTLHPVITTADDSEFGISLSAERTADLGDVGVAVWYDLNADKTVAGIWEGLPSAKEGRFVDINEKQDGSYYVGHSFVTPLAIPYVLERYVPQLAAAVDGDPATTVPSSKI